MHVRRNPVRAQDHPSGNRVAADPIDQNKPAQCVAVRVGLKHNRLAQRQRHLADLVELQFARRHLGQRVDIQHMRHRRHRRHHQPRADLQQIRPALEQRCLIEPGQPRRNLVGGFRQRQTRQHITAGDIDLLVQHQRHRIPCLGLRQIAVHRQHPRHRRGHAGLHVGDLLPRRNPPGRNGAGKATEIQIRPVDILHCHTERRLGRRHARRGVFQGRQQAATGVPRHPIGRRQHIVPGHRANRNRGHLQPAQLGRKSLKIGHNRRESRLIEPDQVHLVHRQHHLTDPQHGRDGRVPPRLVQQAFARIDQQNRQVGG